MKVSNLNASFDAWEIVDGSGAHSLCEKKKVREKSRECHNHKPSPSQTPRGRGNRQNQTSANRTNVRKALRLAPSSPSEVIAMTEKHKNKLTQGKT